MTNGDLAAGRIARAGLGGRVLPWRDVLHEGPVPAGAADADLREVRARFLAERGWVDRDHALRGLAERDAALAAAAWEEEIVLWFEPDLYDQLQLLQVLDRLARPNLATVPVTAVDAVERMGDLRETDARELFAARSALPREAVELGRRAWERLGEPDPRGLEALAAEPDPALPFLAPALRRHLEELPAVGDGLSRSERQALEALWDGTRAAGDAFADAHHARERHAFLGDVVFYAYLERLAEGTRPLVSLSRRPVDAEVEAALTCAGREVLEGRADWIELGGSDRWLGGVHLRGCDVLWRWDRRSARVVGERGGPATRSSASPPDPRSGP